VHEPRPTDRSLQQIKSIRKQRLQRAEAQAAMTQRLCEEASQAVHAAIARVREMDQEAEAFWRTTMQSFLGNQLASTDLLKARHGYRRLKDAAANQRVEAGRRVDDLRQARVDRKAARAEVRASEAANEKLVLWEEAMQAAQPQIEP
jgi:hypothetical protein